MWALAPVEVFEPDLKSYNWTFTATSSATLVARSGTRVAELTVVQVQLRTFKSGSRTSTRARVLVKLYSSNNRPRSTQAVALWEGVSIFLGSGGAGPDPAAFVEGGVGYLA